MKSASITTSLLIAVIVMIAVAARAGADTTYNFASYPSDQNGASLSGTIVTNGNIGFLSASDILNYNVIIDTATGEHLNETGSFSMLDGLYATAIALTMPTGISSAFFIGNDSFEIDWNNSSLYGKAYKEYNFHNGMPSGRYWSSVDPLMGGTNPWLIAQVPGSSTWALNTDGKWFTPDNWIGGVPSGSGTTARFTGPTSAAVNVDNPVTVGQIILDSGTAATNYTLSGSPITLDNNGGVSTIDVEGTHTISAQVVLNNDTTMSGTGTINLAGGISGSYVLNVTSGTLNASSIAVDTLTIGPSAAAVPEPSTVTILCIGVVSLLLYARRKR